MLKVYVETSFFSACVSTRTDAKSAGWRASSLEWWAEERGYFELLVSTEVYNELGSPDYPRSAEALAMLEGIPVLAPDEAAVAVAEILVREQVMPSPSNAGDALHVAMAVANGMNYILTWNVKHLANPNKRMHFEIVCKRLGYAAPQLVTPDLLKASVDDG